MGFLFEDYELVEKYGMDMFIPDFVFNKGGFVIDTPTRNRVIMESLYDGEVRIFTTCFFGLGTEAHPVQLRMPEKERNNLLAKIAVLEQFNGWTEIERCRLMLSKILTEHSAVFKKVFNYHNSNKLNITVMRVRDQKTYAQPTINYDEKLAENTIREFRKLFNIDETRDINLELDTCLFKFSGEKIKLPVGYNNVVSQYQIEKYKDPEAIINIFYSNISFPYKSNAKSLIDLRLFLEKGMFILNDHIHKNKKYIVKDIFDGKSNPVVKKYMVRAAITVLCTLDEHGESLKLTKEGYDVLNGNKFMADEDTLSALNIIIRDNNSHIDNLEGMIYSTLEESAIVSIKYEDRLPLGWLLTVSEKLLKNFVKSVTKPSSTGEKTYLFSTLGVPFPTMDEIIIDVNELEKMHMDDAKRVINYVVNNKSVNVVSGSMLKMTPEEINRTMVREIDGADIEDDDIEFKEFESIYDEAFDDDDFDDDIEDEIPTTRAARINQPYNMMSINHIRSKHDVMYMVDEYKTRNMLENQVINYDLDKYDSDENAVETSDNVIKKSTELGVKYNITIPVMSDREQACHDLEIILREHYAGVPHMYEQIVNNYKTADEINKIVEQLTPGK